MTQSLARKFLSKIPLGGHLLKKISVTDTRIYEVERDLRLLSAEMYFPRLGEQLRSISACLQPKKVIGLNKIRAGRNLDGGYVMLEDFTPITGAYSLGIADEVSWDLEMANRGIRVKQFDYSINRSPVDHALFAFSQKKVETMKDILTEPQKNQILKIDIEGSEWKFFDQASTEELSSFVQIVGEFHYFSFYYQPEWQARALRALQKINRTHQMIHIHANNGGEVFWTDNRLIPDLIELTFVLRSEYRFEETNETFPGLLDFPNHPGKEDYDLDPLLKLS